MPVDSPLIDVISVFVPAVVAFAIGIGITPFITHYLYKHRAWKKRGGRHALDGSEATEFGKIHADLETKVPRMGGIVIWASVILSSILLMSFEQFNFISRGQTWVPLTLLFVGALIGLCNDILEIRASEGFSKGLSLKTRLVAVSALALVAGLWFYDKLDVVGVGIPFSDPLYLGWLVVPLFVAFSLFIYASGVIDGIDGLAGGVFAIIFSTYAGIAFFQNQLDLAAFAAAVAGATLAFLWFNIPPARFYMTETGTMGLTAALAAVVFMTDSLGDGHGLLAFGLIGLPLSATVLSNIVQITSKKVLKKKVFKVAPLHHHFEAVGWPSYKVVMRYWVITAVCALVGFALALMG